MGRIVDPPRPRARSALDLTSPTATGRSPLPGTQVCFSSPLTSAIECVMLATVPLPHAAGSFSHLSVWRMRPRVSIARFIAAMRDVHQAIAHLIGAMKDVRQAIAHLIGAMKDVHQAIARFVGATKDVHRAIARRVGAMKDIRQAIARFVGAMVRPGGW